MSDWMNSTKTAQRIDPFATFKFRIEVDGIEEAAFSECSGLEMATEVFEYQEGGLNEYVRKFPGRTKLSNVTLKRGAATSNYLYQWYHDQEEDLLTGTALTHRQVTITLYSPADPDEKMSWILDGAFPVKWVGSPFKAAEAAVAIETLEFAHHGITHEVEE